MCDIWRTLDLIDVWIRRSADVVKFKMMLWIALAIYVILHIHPELICI